MKPFKVISFVWIVGLKIKTFWIILTHNVEIKLGPISSNSHTLTERRFYRKVAFSSSGPYRIIPVVSPSICNHQLYPSCRPSTKPPSPRLWTDLCILLLRSSELILIWCSCGTKAEYFSTHLGRLPNSRPYKFYKGQLGRRKVDSFGLVFVSFSLVFLQMSCK